MKVEEEEEEGEGGDEEEEEECPSHKVSDGGWIIFMASFALWQGEGAVGLYTWHEMARWTVGGR